MAQEEPDMGSRVRPSLLNFLNCRGCNVKPDDVDEILLSYVVGILQDLTSADGVDDDNDDGDGDEAFDVDAFCEMLVAYLPQTEAISPEEITEWMFEMVRVLNDELPGRADSSGFKASNLMAIDLRSVIEETTKRNCSTGSSKNNSECSDAPPVLVPADRKRVLQVHDNEDANGLDDGEIQEMIGRLMEMFPSSCELEVGHCLNLMGGNLEKTAQLIMQRDEDGKSLQPSDRKMMARSFSRNAKVDDKSVKDRIVGRYGYVDSAEDARYHRPIIKKGDDKKMIRYRDGKIVSTKGERFTQVSKQESAELKKSYVTMGSAFERI